MVYKDYKSMLMKVKYDLTVLNRHFTNVMQTINQYLVIMRIIRVTILKRIKLK